MEKGELKSNLAHGIRTSVRNNLTAYGFTVMVTSSFGVLAATVGAPTVGHVFLFAGGAVTGVTAVEAIASRGFKMRMRGEPSEVVVLGSAFGFVSAGLGIGAATLCGELLGGWLAWYTGPLAASTVYVLASGVEMALAHTAQEGHTPMEEEEEVAARKEGD